jgi:glucuronate isomerase
LRSSADNRFHCHLSPAEIAADKRWDNMTELWLGGQKSGDHYKWRALRTHGVDERYITRRRRPTKNSKNTPT